MWANGVGDVPNMGEPVDGPASALGCPDAYANVCELATTGEVGNLKSANEEGNRTVDG